MGAFSLSLLHCHSSPPRLSLSFSYHPAILSLPFVVLTAPFSFFIVLSLSPFLSLACSFFAFYLFYFVQSLTHVLSLHRSTTIFGSLSHCLFIISSIFLSFPLRRSITICSSSFLTSHLSPSSSFCFPLFPLSQFILDPSLYVSTAICFFLPLFLSWSFFLSFASSFTFPRSLIAPPSVPLVFFFFHSLYFSSYPRIAMSE